MRQVQKEYKAIIIDGASLWNTVKSIQAREINFQGLINVLLRHVGRELPLFEKPIATIHPNYFGRSNGLHDAMKDAGVRAIPATSCNEADDAVVSTWLHQYGLDSNVQEVILVSCDRELIGDLLWIARQRRACGLPITGYVFATTHTNRNGSCRLCSAVFKEMNRSTVVNFSEVNNFRNQIAYT